MQLRNSCLLGIVMQVKQSFEKLETLLCKNLLNKMQLFLGKGGGEMYVRVRQRLKKVCNALHIWCLTTSRDLNNVRMSNNHIEYYVRIPRTY